ncbi:PREDICTED: uncharacterized protein LOC104595338 isoform X2 [Nelumbo nucifera]|uniref:Uncharacterized protein LOC104595338 isoform X2 n=1 Tax=Nelumbo nucifera TaxID=4432 RepID=A0A1U7ZM70_NELNU|nr:PREDICTED: uncharacterized protein LOC104595338 isoform X2 [Nelumbo nucifera]
MVSHNLKSVHAAFTPDGDFLAILSPDGVVKIWNTSNGNLFAEFKEQDEESDRCYSCLACIFIGKKRRKGSGTILLALGTTTGNILAFNVSTGEKKWTSAECHPGGTLGLYFLNGGNALLCVGADGVASEVDPQTGELMRKFKASKKSISSLSLSSDEKVLAVASSKIRVFNLENGKELQKFPFDLDSVQYMAVSDGAKAIVTSGFGDKQLQVWHCDSSTTDGTTGPTLSMKNPPFMLECKNSSEDKDGLVVLSVTESGIAYLWDLKTISQDKVSPTKIMVKSIKAKADRQKSGSAKKGRIPVISARLKALEMDKPISILIAYGSIDCPHFNVLEITNPGEDIIVTAGDMMSRTIAGSLQENEDLGGKENSAPSIQKLESKAADEPMQKKKVNKKRAAPDQDIITTGNTFGFEAMDGIRVDDDLTEPTMGEKLASLNLIDNDKANGLEKQEPSFGTNLPSADSVHVLLKQALHADDRALLLDCLYNQDEKVIANSTSLLNPSDVLKLLDFLMPIIQSRGAVLACALPWLRSLLLQHASSIMSQESSFFALNSLYQAGRKHMLQISKLIP